MPCFIPSKRSKRSLKEIGEKDRFEAIVTNPPFGGEEEAGIQLNFPEATRASETALLFMQFVMRSLKPGGRCGIVVPNGFLFGDGVAARVKAQLLREFNLHTVVRLPNGVFAPYTSIPTNLLFFERTGPTGHIWFYEQPLREGLKNYTKTKPMQFDEFQDLRDWWDARDDPSTTRENAAPLRSGKEHAWKVNVDEVLKVDESGSVLTVNLDLKNPNVRDDLEHKAPTDLAESIATKERQIAALMDEIKSLLVKGV
jgi:type I restriction enzyme M protein